MGHGLGLGSQDRLVMGCALSMPGFLAFRGRVYDGTAPAISRTIMATRSEHAARPGRESLSKRLGKVARQIKARDGGCCVYCGRNAEQSGAHMHLDHLTPKNHGGLDLASNLVVSCRRCNDTRKDMTLPVWAAWARDRLGLVFTAEQILAHAAKPLPAL